MKKRYSSAIFAVLVFALPALAVFSGSNLSATLKSLRTELQRDYQRISTTQEKLSDKYQEQHNKMVDIIKDCNGLSLMLYSQKPDYTFDLSFALEKVSREYDAFNQDRMPYDRIVRGLDIEINRYARLIESLRRLPPELKDVEVLPDSLAYHNDTLDMHLMQNESMLQKMLDEEIKNMQAAMELPFVLDEAGRADRDSCLYYASELLKMYAESRSQTIADSIHYTEAYLRLKESYDYAADYYKILQKSVFVDGQAPWSVVLANSGNYWRQAKDAIREKYDFDYFASLNDSVDGGSKPEDNDITESSHGYLMMIFNVLAYIILFLILWGLSALLMIPVFRFVKPVKEKLAKPQRHYLVLLIACILFILLSSEATEPGAMLGKAIRLANTFMWLLAAIISALLFRLKPEQLKNGVRNYSPTIFTALFVIGCRVLFLPNAVMNYIFPPLLLILSVWQLLVCLIHGRKADKPDAVAGWVSLGVTLIAMFASWWGYIFVALLTLVWWYFQLAALLTIAAVWHLLAWYKERYLNRKVEEYRNNITYVSGPEKEKLMFGATWLYDMLRSVFLPVLAIMSFSMCIRLSLNVFDFTDLSESLFNKPFVLLINKAGEDGFRMTLHALFLLLCLFFWFRYASKALHTVYQSLCYKAFMRKYHRTSIRNNEINLSLGDSIITVFVWFIYIVVVIRTLQIPTGSLGLVAGGLSAGIGIALKDIINNFIYGIQLMGGRLRVGDWIECDGIRGRVTDINYQSTLVITENSTQVAFLNAALFNKNFTNLTRNNSYEVTKLFVGVQYGTDFQKVREVLEKAMEVMKTKDSYGRDVVDPSYGIKVRFGEFNTSSVDVMVKQYVLVAERINYIDKAKEVMYNALKEAGITIPFPQCDVHFKKDDDD